MRKKFTTTLDAELIRQIKIKAIEQNTSVSSLIEKLFTEYIKHNQPLIIFSDFYFFQCFGSVGCLSVAAVTTPKAVNNEITAVIASDT